MITEKFHGSEPAHSLLGFGAMRFPTLANGEIDHPETQKLIDHAIANGINYFDTGYTYHDSKSEGMLREALAAYPRESYFLADKLPMWAIQEEADMERIFNEQLERCGVAYFDYYLAHALSKRTTATMKRVDTVGFFKRKQAEGKIRHIGFSFHDDLDCFRDICGMNDWDFCQLQLNYADWNRMGAQKLYDTAVEYGIPVIVMEPVRGGFLANPPRAAADILEAADPKRSTASWALRFVASLPQVKLVLSGMSNMAQLQDNLATFADESVYLSEPEQQTMTQVMEAMDGIKSIPCTACRYCMPCPAGVEIPTIFSVYNNVMLFGGGESSYISAIPAEGRADACIFCGACVEACPQKIAIPDRLAEAHQRLTTEK
ncbi:MAG: aldo/keto reductase [Angelakisella sp.]